MAKLRAAVLAAGRGIRMGGSRPKTLINVGDHEALLHYILDGVKEAGVDDLLIVTGFRPGEVQEYAAKHWDGPDVVYVRNTRYASWGNFHSVRMAIDQSPGHDLLVVNSDIVVDPDIYKRVIAAQGDIVLAVEKRYDLDAEDMRVRLDGDRVRDIGKDLERQFSAGEFCGVSLVRPPAHAPYQDVATGIEWQRASSLYYEDIYRELTGRVDMRAVELSAGQYAEVDTPEDMKRAADVIQQFYAAERATVDGKS